MRQGKYLGRLVAALGLMVLLAVPHSALAGETGTLNHAQVAQKVQLLEKIIGDYYLFDYDSRELEEGQYSGMLAGLGDEYSAYYTKDEYDHFIEEMQGNYCGIGLTVEQNLITGTITVKETDANGPASRSGILPGDILTAVNGVPTSGKLLDDIICDEIRGEAGTAVTVTIYRPDTGETLVKEIKRAVLENFSVKSRMLTDQIGYVQITLFDERTAEQFEQAVTTLQAQGMRRLIIDLRDNPGGILASAVDMLAYLLPPGKIAYTMDKNGEGTLYQSKDGYLIESGYPEKEPAFRLLKKKDEHELKLPMAVLVNQNSASAAELFAGVLKDYHWAAIVGEQTFGKGIVQNVFSLTDGSAVTLTVSQYYTPSGYEIHQNGITPDVKIAPDNNAPPGGDMMLEKAIEVVKNR